MIPSKKKKVHQRVHHYTLSATISLTYQPLPTDGVGTPVLLYLALSLSHSQDP